MVQQRRKGESAEEKRERKAAVKGGETGSSGGEERDEAGVQGRRGRLKDGQPCRGRSPGLPSVVSGWGRIVVLRKA